MNTTTEIERRIIELQTEHRDLDEVIDQRNVADNSGPIAAVK